MKNKNVTITLLLLSLTGITPLTAQDINEKKEENEFKISFQIRPRAEVRNGVFTPILTTQKSAAFVSQRSRIGFNYSKGKKLSMGLRVQSVNVWGNDPQVQTTGNTISVFEAWAQIKLGNVSSLKLGRQVLSYDDERILGELDWHNAGRKHDALLYRYEKNRFKADIAFAFNQNSEKVNNTFFNDEFSQPYKSLQFVWAKYKFSESLSASVLLMNIHRQSNTDSSSANLQTTGFNINYKKNKLEVNSSFYYQTGNANFKNTPSQKTSAAMAAIFGNYSFTKKFSLGFGSDYLSGMDLGSTSPKNTTFNPLYGTHHKFYGLMDYFYVGNPHRNTGLWDNYLSANFKASTKTSYQIAFHHFTSPVTLMNYQSQKVNSYLGDEIDLTFNHEIDKGIKLLGGYSQMFAGNSMRYIKNISDNSQIKPFQYWLWISININPEIILIKR